MKKRVAETNVFSKRMSRGIFRDSEPVKAS